MTSPAFVLKRKSALGAVIHDDHLLSSSAHRYIFQFLIILEKVQRSLKPWSSSFCNEKPSIVVWRGLTKINIGKHVVWIAEILDNIFGRDSNMLAAT